MNFNNALNLMKSGYRMCRPTFAKGAYVSFVKSDHIKESKNKCQESTFEGTIYDRDGNLEFTMTDGSSAPFVALFGDVGAEDWEDFK